MSDSAMSAAGLMLSAKIADPEFDDLTGSSSYNIMKKVMKYRKIDSHIHLYLSPSTDPGALLDYADRLGIEKLFISRPVTRQDWPHQEFRDSNDMMIKAMKQYPGRFIAQFTLNPKFPKESLEEINRCVDQGMVGLKVYFQVKLSDPLFYPIV